MGRSSNAVAAACHMSCLRRVSPQVSLDTVSSTNKSIEENAGSLGVGRGVRLLFLTRLLLLSRPVVGASLQPEVPSLRRHSPRSPRCAFVSGPSNAWNAISRYCTDVVYNPKLECGPRPPAGRQAGAQPGEEALCALRRRFRRRRSKATRRLTFRDREAHGILFRTTAPSCSRARLSRELRPFPTLRGLHYLFVITITTSTFIILVAVRRRTKPLYPIRVIVTLINEIMTGHAAPAVFDTYVRCFCSTVRTRRARTVRGWYAVHRSTCTRTGRDTRRTGWLRITRALYLAAFISHLFRAPLSRTSRSAETVVCTLLRPVTSLPQHNHIKCRA